MGLVPLFTIEKISDRPAQVFTFREPEELLGRWVGRGNSALDIGRDQAVGHAGNDISVHGGRDKAVYVYPVEHYSFWRDEFPDVDISWGIFGENLTTMGVTEESVQIGDRFLIGSAELHVTQPRMPCIKPAIRFGRKEIVKRFLESRRSGWYCAVDKEGTVTAGDAIELIDREPESVSVKEVLELHETKNPERKVLEKVVGIKGLSEAWRGHFQKKLAR